MIHKAAVITIALAVGLDVLFGILFSVVEHVSIGVGLYWALTTATTVGYGDYTPHTALGHWIAAAVMLTVVPLFAATFSLFSSSVTTMHIRRSERNIRHHVTDHFNKHEGNHEERRQPDSGA